MPWTGVWEITRARAHKKCVAGGMGEAFHEEMFNVFGRRLQCERFLNRTEVGERERGWGGNDSL